MRDESLKLNLAPSGPATERPISIAIVAMGGQGGGVLTDWIVHLAESQGWVAQSTSVPGVAQRTGATIYYVEMMQPMGDLKPILSMMPTPGDVDVVISSEFMEAGRSILRGIVTPDKTTLITSNHRTFAVTEKIGPGNDIADSGAVTDALGVAALRTVTFNMDELAVRHGSVISSALFGALAATGRIPFPKEAFLDIIVKSGKGVEASRATFEAAYARTVDGEAPDGDAQAGSESKASVAASVLDRELEAALPAPSHDMARAGLNKVLEFQGLAYGREYLRRMGEIAALDTELDGASRSHELTTTAAKYLANAMAYDDVIRVADLKTRSTRRTRVENEVGLKDAQLLQTTEYMHPRAEEVVGLLPVGLARSVIARPGLYQWIDRRVNKGRRIKTYSIASFLMLYIVGGMRKMRLKSLRHSTETAHLEAWLAQALAAARQDYALGVEMLGLRRLVKGYSDTHARGLSKFDKAMNATKMLEGRDDAAAWTRRLRDAALRDPSGDALDGLIKTMESTFA